MNGRRLWRAWGPLEGGGLEEREVILLGRRWESMGGAKFGSFLQGGSQEGQRYTRDTLNGGVVMAHDATAIAQ